MNKKKLNAEQTSRLHRLVSAYPDKILADLQEVAKLRNESLYVTGGALRDWLLGERPNDLDFTINHGALGFVKQLREKFGKGTIVPLGMRHDDTCRIVIQGLTIDISGFRRGTMSIEEDLAKRDFTVNAMAVEVGAVVGDGWDIAIVDPMDGLGDMHRKVLKACPSAFSDDPLRMMRAFRFCARLGYSLEPATRSAIASRVNLINMSAAERICYEFDQIMMSSRAHKAVVDMDSVGLLDWIAPELCEGRGVDQPAFHHLDVFQHNLLTLESVEQIIADPTRFFREDASSVARYLDDPNMVMIVKWAALFHDVGKPVTKKIVPEKGDRITFHGHDREGVLKFLEFGKRLKWSRKNRDLVSLLIDMHMHPFHLCNVMRDGTRLTNKSRLKICRKAGDELPGLFLLAMADSLAGQGVDKPDGMERELFDLYVELEKFYRDTIEPVLKGPKLLTGNDLIATLGLSPGPEFRKILAALDLAVIEKEVTTRDEALIWVGNYLGNNRLSVDTQ